MRYFYLIASLFVLSACARETNSLPLSANNPAARTVGAVGRQLPPHDTSVGVLFSFGGSDGAFPQSNLTEVDGTLYGTTTGGGANNRGTVFAIDPSGAERVIYSFQGGADGSLPVGPLAYANGMLYGTTPYGGDTQCDSGSSCGTVFAVTTSGSEHIVHAFTGGTHGSTPGPGLVSINGELYGTTQEGGSSSGVCSDYGCGIVFKIDRSGTERVLHKFSGADGWKPSGSLTAVDGVLYGATLLGGGTGCYKLGCGVVFQMSVSGAENVLYSFAGGADGAEPNGGLIDIGGMLYGTTYVGGGPCIGFGAGCGTVFALTSAGQETVLHRFRAATDGVNPDAGLTALNGVLYGTTVAGGSINSSCQGNSGEGCGTIFEITKGGEYKSLYAFRSQSDGRFPVAGLIDVAGTLYGSTESGGSACTYCGTIFTFKP